MWACVWPAPTPHAHGAHGSRVCVCVVLVSCAGCRRGVLCMMFLIVIPCVALLVRHGCLVWTYRNSLERRGGKKETGKKKERKKQAAVLRAKQQKKRPKMQMKKCTCPGRSRRVKAGQRRVMKRESSLLPNRTKRWTGGEFLFSSRSAPVFYWILWVYVPLLPCAEAAADRSSSVTRTSPGLLPKPRVPPWVPPVLPIAALLAARTVTLLAVEWRA